MGSYGLSCHWRSEKSMESMYEQGHEREPYEPG